MDQRHMYSEFFKTSSHILEVSLNELREDIKDHLSAHNSLTPITDLVRVNLIIDTVAKEFIEKVAAQNIISYNQIIERENSLDLG